MIEGMDTARAITYHRVSTDDQASSGLGLEAQETTTRTAVEARGWELTGTFTDAGRSGSRGTRRPELAAALAELDAGRADVLVVAKLDRLSRSVIDFVRMTERARKRGWSLVTLDIDVDTTNPTGALVVGIMAQFAQYERELIAQRTREAMQAKKRRGARLGRPVTLPEQVRSRIAAERAAGTALQAIADDLNAEQVPTARGGRWWPSTVAAVLTSVELDADAERRFHDALEMADA